ncbi:hypothetical protein [Paenibacillus monticola]|uniref:Uncharacterized protein n=1 Tax=Paenibacillus monticola TaxID=2666075 RepID=A0A7X2HB02_9BACL|nr:hypothetical protein [Paenibacillus monticola]MRN56789.1 hypothetical protein [Paenibacillus monticola]
MVILIIFFIFAVLYKREIKTIISFLFLGVVVMIFWEDIKIIAAILSLIGFTVFFILAIISLFKRDKTAIKKFLFSTLCFIFLAVSIANDDSSSLPIEQPSTSPVQYH